MAVVFKKQVPISNNGRNIFFFVTMPLRTRCLKGLKHQSDVQRT